MILVVWLLAAVASVLAFALWRTRVALDEVREIVWLQSRQIVKQSNDPPPEDAA
jgi:hypothetical protein